jgi:glycosyltransferase involved in cell wall biosynthesis
MTRNPRITVITPCYNHALFVEETIRSVISQSYPDLEYMVIDGGSTDGSLDIIKRYTSDLASIESAADNGQAAAINKGFRRATGDLICWLNSDDLFEPDTLNRVAEIYRSSVFQFLHGDAYILRGRRKKYRRSRPVSAGDLAVRNVILQPSTFWTRAVVEKIGGLDETLHYGPDWDFFIRISQHFPMTYVPMAFSTYRLHESNKTLTGGRERAEEIVRIVERYAPADWQDAFREVLEHHTRLQGPSRLSRVVRALALVATHPRLVLRHGIRRSRIAMMKLS